MTTKISLEYWIDDSWFVGRLIGIPGVFSQGKTLDDLIENIKDAHSMMIESEDPLPVKTVPNYIEIDLPV